MIFVNGPWTFAKAAVAVRLARFAVSRGCVKRFLPPSAAEYSFETYVFFMILRSKIMKNT
jgi:hypothetical protein